VNFILNIPSYVKKKGGSMPPCTNQKYLAIYGNIYIIQWWEQKGHSLF